MNTDYLRFYSSLTKRQQEVLQLVALGLSNQDIANRLIIEPSVVAGHLTNIYSELEITLLADEATRPNRLKVIRMFTLFFDRYPELMIFTVDKTG